MPKLRKLEISNRNRKKCSAHATGERVTGQHLPSPPPPPPPSTFFSCSIVNKKRFTALITNTRTLKFKSRLHNCVFAAVNQNYDHNQWTLKHRNTQNGSKSANHKSQTLTFWTRLSKVLFPKRSVKMIDGREKRKCQLVEFACLWKAQ